MSSAVVNTEQTSKTAVGPKSCPGRTSKKKQSLVPSGDGGAELLLSVKHFGAWPLAHVHRGGSE
jgi:hypothetical protein